MAMICVGCSDTKKNSVPVEGTAASTNYVELQVMLPTAATPLTYPEVPVTGATNVRDILVAASKAYPGFTFTDTAYIGMGHLLTSINGLRNAHGAGAYWQFCVHNVASDRGIDAMEVHPGQSVSWHYAEYGKLPCKKIGE